MTRALLPHEWLFGAFLFLTWGRLLLAGGLLRPDSLGWLALIAANGLLIHRCRVRESSFTWRLRLLYYPLAMNAAYNLMRYSVPVFAPHSFDGLLQRIDVGLLGTNLSVRMEPLVSRPLTEVMSFCYILFLPYLTLSMLWYFLGELELCRQCYVGLFSLYGLGFLGYSLVPALGPYLAMPGDFHTPLEGWWITHWNSQVVLRGSNRVDVFPSLHCAVSSYFLFFDRKHRPWRFRLYLVPCLGLWLSTIYLRYHYVIDCVCGFGLSAASLWIAERFGQEGPHAPAPEVHGLPGYQA